MGYQFDGPNKLIILTSGTTDVEVKDLYSKWKEWLLLSDNCKFLPAISVLGGDPISEIINLGSTFFLENGWKIKPQEASHILTVSGNLYSRDGSSPFVSTDGDYNVLISMARSNLIDTVATGGSSGSYPSTSEIATAVWNRSLSSNALSGTFGEFIQKKILTVGKFLGLK